MKFPIWMYAYAIPHVDGDAYGIPYVDGCAIPHVDGCI